MAATYRVIGREILLGANKSLLALFNGVGSSNVLKVNRIWLLNNQLAAITGILVTLELRLITAHTIGTLVTPAKSKLASPNLDANVVSSMGATVTETSLFRRIVWSADEPAQTENTMDTLELMPSINIIWDSGYSGSSVESLILNAGQGVHIKCVTSTVASNLGNIIMEFTT